MKKLFILLLTLFITIASNAQYYRVTKIAAIDPDNYPEEYQYSETDNYMLVTSDFVIYISENYNDGDCFKVDAWQMDNKGKYFYALAFQNSTEVGIVFMYLTSYNGSPTFNKSKYAEMLIGYENVWFFFKLTEIDTK